MVLVPQWTPRIPQNGGAAWRRAALSLLGKTEGVLRPLGRRFTVLGVTSFVFDPGDALGAPSAGETTTGDATVDGALSDAIGQRIRQLRRIRDPMAYRAKLLELRELYHRSYWLKHMLVLIDLQLKLLDSVLPQSEAPD